MSGNVPSPRRRIAGEAKSATAAKKASVSKMARVGKKPVPARPANKSTLAKSPALDVTSAALSGPGPVTRGLPPAREMRWLIPAALVSIAALVVGAMIAVQGISDRGNGVESSNSQAATAASAAAETIFSFRYDKLPTHLSASKKVMTKSFTKDFDEIAPALTELAPQRKIVVQAVTREAAATECGRKCSTSKVNVLVFVDQVRQIGDEKEPTVFGNRITMSMVKQGGVWLVNDIRAL